MNLDLGTIRNTAMWVLIAIAIVAIVLAIIIKKIVGKIITLVLAAIIIFFGYQQRASVINYANNAKAGACAQHPTFFGVAVAIPGC